MNTQRLEKLLEFYEKDQHDPFTLYALALEYVGHEPEKAAFFFERLLHDFPEYSATYYHAAHFFWEQENWQKAEQVFKRGLEICELQAEQKALSELKNAYQNFQFEKED